MCVCVYVCVCVCVCVGVGVGVCGWLEEIPISPILTFACAFLPERRKCSAPSSWINCIVNLKG